MTVNFHKPVSELEHLQGELEAAEQKAFDQHKLVGEAHTEIEELRGELERVEGELSEIRQDRTRALTGRRIQEERADAAESRVEALRAGVERLADYEIPERNPDGEDQAAHSMRLIARELLLDQKGEGTCETCGGKEWIYGGRNFGAGPTYDPRENERLPCPDCTTGKQGEAPTLSSEEATALVAAYFSEDHDAKSAEAAIKRLGDWLDGVYDAGTEVKRPFEDEGFAPDTEMPPMRRPVRPARAAWVRIDAGGAPGPRSRRSSGDASVDSNLNQGGHVCDLERPCEPNDHICKNARVAGAAAEERGGPETSDGGVEWPATLTVGRETDGERITAMFVVAPGEVVDCSIQTRTYEIPAPQPSHVEGEADVQSLRWAAEDVADEKVSLNMERAAHELEVLRRLSTQQIDIQGLIESLETKADEEAARSTDEGELELERIRSNAREAAYKQAAQLVRELFNNEENGGAETPSSPCPPSPKSSPSSTPQSGSTGSNPASAEQGLSGSDSSSSCTGSGSEGEQ